MSENNNEQNVQEQSNANSVTVNTEPTKKCKYCQSDIPMKAKVCPVCKRKQKKNTVLIVILIIVVLSFVACGTMCGAIGGAVSDSVDEVVKEEEKKEAKQKEVAEKEYKVGDTVKSDDFICKYVSVKDYKSDNEFMQPKKGNKFIRLDFEFENTNKDDDLFVSTASFTCTADDYDCEAQYFDVGKLDAELAPGKKTKGPIFFEVPKDAKKIEVQYECNFWLENKITLVVK